MSAPESLVLLFRVLDCTLATPAVTGLRCRPLTSCVPADEDALPLRGVLPPALPLIDLACLLGGVPGEGLLALELPTPRGPLGFLVADALDVVPLAGSPRPLPPLLRPLVPHAACWSVGVQGTDLLLLLNLAHLLDDAAVAALQAASEELLLVRGRRR